MRTTHGLSQFNPQSGESTTTAALALVQYSHPREAMMDDRALHAIEASDDPGSVKAQNVASIHLARYHRTIFLQDAAAFRVPFSAFRRHCFAVQPVCLSLPHCTSGDHTFLFAAADANHCKLWLGALQQRGAKVDRLHQEEFPDHESSTTVYPSDSVCWYVFMYDVSHPGLH